MKRTPIQRRTPLKRGAPPRRKRPTPRTHKTVVRLTGESLEMLRLACYQRAGGRSELSGVSLFFKARYPGDPLAYDMAHLRSRGAGGGDTLDNVMCLAHEEHMAAHAGKFKLPMTYEDVPAWRKEMIRGN